MSDATRAHRAPHTPLLLVDATSRAALVSPTSPGTDPGTGASWTGLADSLAHDLAVLFDRAAPIPTQKARLTRIGGRCPTHGSFLEFDPFQAHDHWCTSCSRVYHATEHDQWWAMNAQLWTAERAVHSATLHALRGDDRHAAICVNILRRYSEQYERWPNADNVLGPSRPFFSTYLESIWLLNVCHALSLLEGTTAQWTAADASQLRDRVIEPSASLIDGFPEGRSNRQVWNEVAICSALTLLGRPDSARRRLCSPQGICGLIDTGLDADGFWYEGENYHLFAHRGLWYGVELMRALETPLPARLDARYSAGFVAPFLGLLPDETFPSRRDAQYGSSIRQWRTAEWCELGWTHAHDPRSAAVLSALYDSQTPRRDTGRACSTADAERNTAPTALTRADLSWRALLMGEVAMPNAVHTEAASVCLPSQGLAIVRRDGGRTYVALEGGMSGGGHGHPDQLSLTLQTAEARWLEDPGTGSYVEPRLAWYRSTLAHYAPLFDRQTQSNAEAQVVAFEERGAVGWIAKRVEEIIPGVSAQRALLVGDGYLIDVLDWECARETELSLPIAAAAFLIAPSASEAAMHGAIPEAPGAVSTSIVNEDRGFSFLTGIECLATGKQFSLVVSPSFARPPAHDPPAHDPPAQDPPAQDQTAAPSLRAYAAARARVWYATSHVATLHRAVAPAAPGQGDLARHWITVRAARGRVVGVWSWPTMQLEQGCLHSVALSATNDVTALLDVRDGTRVSHRYRDGHWRVETLGREEMEPIVFHASQSSRGAQATAAPPHSSPPSSTVGHVDVHHAMRVPMVPAAALSASVGAMIPEARCLTLAERHYVPTERSWRDAGSPTAQLQLVATTESFVVEVNVDTGLPTASADVRDNPLDNELHDVNADGIQWYFGAVERMAVGGGEWRSAGLVVPVANPHGGLNVRSTRLLGPELAPDIVARRTTRGWVMRLTWDRAELPLARDNSIRFELVVNERPPERERRRGQLVLSGGGGFGYLAGSRRPVDGALRLVLGDNS